MGLFFAYFWELIEKIYFCVIVIVVQLGIEFRRFKYFNFNRAVVLAIWLKRLGKRLRLFLNEIEMGHNWRMGHKSLLSAIATIHYTPVVDWLITTAGIFYFAKEIILVLPLLSCRPFFL